MPSLLRILYFIGLFSACITVSPAQVITPTVKHGKAPIHNSDTDKQRCVTYGICKEGGKMLPCSFSGPPKLFDLNSTATLRELCPQLPGIDGDKVHTCCDVSQMQNLKKNMHIPTSMFQKCPACLRNFINVFCVLTCHPDQAKFLKLVKMSRNDADPAALSSSQPTPLNYSAPTPRSDYFPTTNPTAVLKLEYHVTDSSARALYSACKDVTFLNSKVVYFMCGKAGRKCTYDKFFEFLGHNPQNPLTIDFYFTSSSARSQQGPGSSSPLGDGIEGTDIPNFPCDAPLPGAKGLACSCKDCEAACVNPMPVLEPDDPFWLGGDGGGSIGGALPWRVLGMDGMIFVMTCAFLIFVVSFISALVCNTATSAARPNKWLLPYDEAAPAISYANDCLPAYTTISNNNLPPNQIQGKFIQLIVPNDKVDGNDINNNNYNNNRSSFRKQLSDKFTNGTNVVNLQGLTRGSSKLKRGGGATGGDSTEKFVIDPCNTAQEPNGLPEDEVTKKFKNYIPPRRSSRSPFKRFRLKRGNNCQTDVHNMNGRDRSNEGFQGYLADRFRDWGYVCARYPGPILALGLVSCVIMSCGLSLMKVTTDPVQLWSAPTSRARQELAYFNEHFTPFYRIQQLIVTPVNQESVVYGKKSYGPIFRSIFLAEALKLQLSLTQLKAYNHSIPIDGKTHTKNVSLDDICFKPLAPANENCTIQSLFQYYQNSPQLLANDFPSSGDDKTLTHFEYCSRNPLLTDSSGQCISMFGGPINPWFVLGGYKGDKYEMSKAIIITFVINNEPANKEKAELWESAFIDHMLNYTNPLFTFTFQAERSIQDELDRESKSDIFTISLSYFIMFLYIAIALGHFRSIKTLLVDSRISIGIAGVLIVLASVTSSLGTFSYIGIPATLIIMEVVPFLVLAVGIDNVFILVHQTRRIPRAPDTTIEEHIGNVLGKVGPSMLLTSLSESVAFFIGACSNMPAVQIFSLYAGLAVLYDFCLQVTCFISLLAMDIKRLEARRHDICCCLPPVDIENLDESSPNSNGSIDKLPVEHVAAVNQSSTAQPSIIHMNNQPPNTKEFGVLYNFTQKYYAPFLLNSWIRAFVMVLYAACLAISIVLASRIHIGLDQKVSMPHDSYVLRHFESMETYLAVGPPVYFVLKVNIPPPYTNSQLAGWDSSNYPYKSLDLKLPDHQNILCSRPGCERYSFVNMITWHSEYPNISYLSPLSDVSSWIDDYLDWIEPDTGCCRIMKDSIIPDNMTFCPSSKVLSGCKKCPVKFAKGTNRPIGRDFYDYLPFFLRDIPGPSCPKAGKAAYEHAVKIKGNNPATLETAHFMAYHTVLKNSNDYTLALRHARILSANLTKYLNSRIHNITAIPDPSNNSQGSKGKSTESIFSKLGGLLKRQISSYKLGDLSHISSNSRGQLSAPTTDVIDPHYVQVFPYSVFYVFYEQYLTIVKDAIWNLTICIAAIFAVTLICCCGLKGALILTIIVTFSILSITLGLFAFMFLFEIELNAVSLVNCVMALGISVEFVSHMVRAFAVHASNIAQQIRISRKTNDGQVDQALTSVTNSDIRIFAAKRALIDTGSSVFSGIAMTKLLGICVLAFSKSRIFSLYYFRMYLGVVFLGTLQGLLFLPVLLSYIGPVPGISSAHNFHQYQDEQDIKREHDALNATTNKTADDHVKTSNSSSEVENGKFSDQENTLKQTRENIPQYQNNNLIVDQEDHKGIDEENDDFTVSNQVQTPLIDRKAVKTQNPRTPNQNYNGYNDVLKSENDEKPFPSKIIPDETNQKKIQSNVEENDIGEISHKASYTNPIVSND